MDSRTPNSRIHDNRTSKKEVQSRWPELLANNTGLDMNKAYSLNDKGCEFGRMNRTRIASVESNMDEIRKSLISIQEKNTQMFNHFTERYEEMFEKMRDRVPQWSIIVTGILCAAVGGLGVWALTH